MGQAPSTEGAIDAHGGAGGEAHLSPTDWTQQVLAEYSKLQHDHSLQQGPTPLSASGGPLLPTRAAGDGTGEKAVHTY